MRTSVNLLMQIAAVAVFAGMRLNWGGWETLGFIIAVFPVLVMLVPTVLAACLLGRGRLGWTLWVPFAGMAAGMALAGAFISGWSDIDEPRIPVFELLGLPGRRSEWHELTDMIGFVGTGVFLAGLLWVVVELVVKGVQGLGRRLSSRSPR